MCGQPHESRNTRGIPDTLRAREKGSVERQNELSQRKIRTRDVERGFEDEGEVIGSGKYLE